MKKPVEFRRRFMSHHHIIPKSREKEPERPYTALIEDGDHKRYHAIFSNMKPTEILRHLVVYYWAGDWRYLEEALKELRPKD